MNKIKFYKSNAPYGFLNNFYPAKMFIYGHWWNHVEGPYQYCKTDPISGEVILKAKSPREARDLGQKVLLRPDWDQVKDKVMKQCLLAKFTQNKDLLESLINTGEAELIEDSPIDYYWGCGKDDSGQNKLGKLLMEVRGILKE